MPSRVIRTRLRVLGRLAPLLASAAVLCAAGCGGSSAGGAAAPDAVALPATTAFSTAPATPTTSMPQAPPPAPTTQSDAATAAPPAAQPTPEPTTQAPEPPHSGSGTFTTVQHSIPAADPGSVRRYAVQVEAEVPVDPSDFAQQIHSTLTDPRGWQVVDGIAFEQVADPSQADFIVTLATPATTDRLCAPLDTGGWLDCFNGRRAIINSDRWLQGAESWGADIEGYRQQVVNHEVGHALGHGHLYCPGPNQPAPVMQQQTISLQGCAPNAWPAVTGG